MLSFAHPEHTFLGAIWETCNSSRLPSTAFITVMVRIIRRSLNRSDIPLSNIGEVRDFSSFKMDLTRDVKDYTSRIILQAHHTDSDDSMLSDTVDLYLSTGWDFRQKGRHRYVVLAICIVSSRGASLFVTFQQIVFVGNQSVIKILPPVCSAKLKAY